MRYYYFLLFSLLTFSVYSQHIYVQSYIEAEGGWIVSPSGETIYEIPAGWQPQAYNGPMAEITFWPLLFKKRAADDKLRFAMLTQDLEWQAIASYLNINALSKRRFRALLPDYKHFVLLNIKGERINQDSFFDIRRYYKKETIAIASTKINSGVAVAGLIDTLGQWVISPSFRSLKYLSQDRYLGQDSLNNQYLLKPEYETGEWDTLVQFDANHISLNYSWPFDQTGHTWVKLSNRKYQIMNLEGQLVGDTLLGFGVRPFVDGRALVQQQKNTYYTDQRGQLLNSSVYTSAKDYSEGRALVEDTLTHYLGYLDKKGAWAIEPAYCYATSFRHGRAIVAPAQPENCSTRVRGRGGDLHIPPSLNHTRRIHAYQLIDTLGNVIWADSCLGFYLPAKEVLGVNYTYHQLAPAIMIKWVNENRSWINPSFTVNRWSQLDSLREHTIKRINLGLRRFEQLYDQTFDLPTDFVERLSSEELQQLEELNVNAHRLTPEAFEAIFELPALRKLSLGYNKLTVLPANIKRLNQLEVLDLSGTELTSLPKAIYRMRHLQKLLIIDTELPAETIPRLRKALPDTEIVFKHQW